MSNFGIKIGLPNIGNRISNAKPDDTSWQTSFASPKIKSGVTPAHFGTLNHVFETTPLPDTRTNLLTINHGYSYTPSCIMQWKFTIPFVNQDVFSLYGIGLLPLLGDFSVYFEGYTDSQNFYIDLVATPSFSGQVSFVNTFTEFRYYIYAENGAIDPAQT